MSRRYESRDGRGLLLVGDSRRLDGVPTGCVGAIITSPPYWVRGRGRASAEAWARRLAVSFGREWRRVLAPGGDVWLVIGDRHDGAEWLGLDAILTGWMRRAGWRLEAKGCWAQVRSRERWDNRLNHVLRFRRSGPPVRPDSTTLCWMLPLPASPRESGWDATPEPVIRTALAKSRKRGAVLDPFLGAGTVALVARRDGRPWIGVERDPRMARLAARRLGLVRAGAAAGARLRARGRGARAARGRIAGARPRRTRSPRGAAGGLRS
jgi:DNA modification methylase